MTTKTVDIQRRFLPMDAQTERDNLTFSFSSEQPVERYFGEEVLDHDEESVDLTRLNTGAAPLLFNHDPNQVLGKVTKAWIEDKRGKATIKWATNPRALEIRKDVENNILENISVGYQVNQVEQDEEITRAISWQPVELSIVSIPADPSIGVNRSTSIPANQMSSTPVSNYEPINTSIPDEFARESDNFSIIQAAKGIASGRGLSGRELEINTELERVNGKRTQGFFVPSNGWSTRAYVAGTAASGGNLIATEHLADRFVDSLRNSLAVAELGATMLPSLVGNVDIPTRSGSASAYWIGADNSDSITESTGALGSIAMTPKTIGAYSKFSHLMDLQATPEIEGLVRSDFLAVIAEAIDLAAIAGTGSSNQPRGILNTSGIGSVAGGTNGLAPTIDHLLELKKEISIDNADVSTAGYLTNTKVEAALSQLKDDQSNYLLNPYGASLGDSRISGRRLVVSNNVPSNLSKGTGSNLSAIIYGNFADLMIGMWGNLEILVDPYTDFAKGTTGIRALQSIDIAVRHPQSFAAMVDAIAT